MRASSNPSRQPGSVQTFWARVTEGFELHQLWGQFMSEARASYRLYSADVNWEGIEARNTFGKFIRSVWALFQAMLMKLTPARRVLLLLAIVLLMIHQPDFISGDSAGFSSISPPLADSFFLSCWHWNLQIESP